VLWVLHDYENNNWGSVRSKIGDLPTWSILILFLFDGNQLVLDSKLHAGDLICTCTIYICMKLEILLNAIFSFSFHKISH